MLKHSKRIYLRSFELSNGTPSAAGARSQFNRLSHLSSELLVRLILALIVVLSLSANRALAEEKAKPVQTSLDPPMTFDIVRSDNPYCEPTCPQWIAAQGRITSATPAAFKKVLKKIGKTRPPVILNSPGGDVNAAMSIGKMIRANKLEVAIGRTAYAGCGLSDIACRPKKLPNGAYSGSVLDGLSYCNSACPLILAAGIERNAGAIALVGVHQFSTTVTQEKILYRETYRIVKGKKKVISTKIINRKPGKSYVTTKISKTLKRTLTSYLSGMGVDPVLLDLLEKAPPTSIYWLSLNEMDQTKLTTNHLKAYKLVTVSHCQFAPMPDYCIAAPTK